MALQGTQETELFEGPLQAHKASNDTPVHLWTVGTRPAIWTAQAFMLQTDDP